MIIAVVCIISAYDIVLNRVDTKYAISFSDVFGSYDIIRVDKYLDNNTIIIWQGKSATYSELRNNVKKTLNEKKYKLAKDGSYGNGDDKFIDNVQSVLIELHILQDFDGKSNKEILVEMEIEKIGIYKFRVKSIKSSDLFFGKLFFEQ